MLLAVLALTLSIAGPASGQTAGPTPLPPPAPDDRTDPPPLYTFDQYPPSANDNVVLQWDEELLQAFRALPPGPTVVARAIHVLHTAIFDAWSAYDPKATATRLGRPSRPTPGSHPGQQEQGDQLRRLHGAGRPVPDPEGRLRRADGNAGLRHQRHRHLDPSQGRLPLGPVGAGLPPQRRLQPAQRLRRHHRLPAGQHLGHGQRPLALAAAVRPTAAARDDDLRLGAAADHAAVEERQVVRADLPVQYTPPGPDKLANGSFDPKNIDDLLALTSGANGSGLTDKQKVTAEYWADGPKSEFPPGHWALIAQVVSRIRVQQPRLRRADVLRPGQRDAGRGIAAWAAKYKWDFVRPTTAIRERYKDQLVTSWLESYQGYGQVDGSQWIPYQSPSVVTPPFPEYVSGHSTFSSAAATILNLFTGSDAFNAYVTVKAGTSLFEPKTADHPTGYTPATDVTLTWPTLTAAAKDAGLSRRLGGIHFQDADEDGYALGRSVGANVLVKTHVVHQRAALGQVAPLPGRGCGGGWLLGRLRCRRLGRCGA